jgi:hypothetical protein
MPRSQVVSVPKLVTKLYLFISLLTRLPMVFFLDFPISNSRSYTFLISLGLNFTIEPTSLQLYCRPISNSPTVDLHNYQAVAKRLTTIGLGR